MNSGGRPGGSSGSPKGWWEDSRRPGERERGDQRHLCRISGAAVADAAAIGSIMIPAMKKAGYSAKFTAAVNAAAATIGPIFPPSIPMIIYGVIANVSVGKPSLPG